MWKKIFLVLFISLVFIYQINAALFNITTGVKIPLAYGFNSLEDYKTWTGLQYGIGVFADVKLPVISNKISTEVDLAYSVDKFNMDEEEFSKGSFMKFNNLRTTILGKYWILPGIYAGAGIEFVTQLSGTWGDDDSETDFEDDELGTDTYLSIVSGISVPFINMINLIGEIKGTYDLTIEDAQQWDMGVRLGAGYSFGL